MDTEFGNNIKFKRKIYMKDPKNIDGEKLTYEDLVVGLREKKYKKIIVMTGA